MQLNFLMGFQSYLAGFSKSCEKSVLSAHMTKWKYCRDFASSWGLQNLHQCSFHYFEKFWPIRFMNFLKYIIKYLKHSQTLVLIIVIYQANVMPKVSFFVSSDIVLHFYNYPWRLSFNEIIQIWNSTESVN